MFTSNTLQVKTYPEKAQDNPTEINGKEMETINPPPSTRSLSLSVSLSLSLSISLSVSVSVSLSLSLSLSLCLSVCLSVYFLQRGVEQGFPR